MLTTVELLEVLKIIIFSSVLFVWVIRYQNIVAEFKQFKYPDWLRDLVGILKITFVVMLMRSDVSLVKLGAMGIIFLMLMALITHLKSKSPPFKMLPSLTLLILSFSVFTLA
ncbi:MAG: DoxX family protein [Bacteriovoracaceae bacterium]|nr:DoxX family protein [Bacteriovoracaceae bacterium]